MDQHRCTRCHLTRSWAYTTFLLLGVLLSTSVQAAPHFVTFINDSDRTVTSIEAAQAGTHRWSAVDLGGPLIGGGSGQAAVRFDGMEACKQDLSVTYRGMAPLTISEFDICRSNRPPRLPAMDVPLLVIHDRKDRETPWQNGERSAALWPGARLFSTEGLGHNCLVDDLDVLSEALSFIGPAASRPQPQPPGVPA